MPASAMNAGRAYFDMSDLGTAYAERGENSLGLPLENYADYGMFFVTVLGAEGNIAMLVR